MFIGHFAVAFASKRATPPVSLGTLFLACQLPDLLWPILVLAGIEVVEIAPGITAVTPLDFVSYPYSHSLIASVIWASGLALAYWLVKRPPWSAAVLLAGVVLSHWLLDVVSHRPDMPIGLAGGSRVGLGLWNSLPATVAVEGVLFVLGAYLYSKATEASNRTGRYSLWALIVFLLVVYAANLLGPPPPSARAVAGVGLSLWLLVAWGYWVDRNRRRPARGQG